jgi:hypothetical protein
MQTIEHYRERLRVPHGWWLPPVFFILVIPLGTAEYLGPIAGLIALVLMIAGVARLLVSYGAIDLVIDDTRFRAGPESVELRFLAAVSPLDAEQAHLMPGRRWCCVGICRWRCGWTSPTRRSRCPTGTSRRGNPRPWWRRCAPLGNAPSAD